MAKINRKLIVNTILGLGNRGAVAIRGDFPTRGCFDGSLPVLSAQAVGYCRGRSSASALDSGWKEERGERGGTALAFQLKKT